MACFRFPFMFSSLVVVALSLMLAFAHSSLHDLASSSGFAFLSSTRFSTIGEESHLFVSIRHCPGVTYGHKTPCSC
jgi:hypothetical protein